MKVIFDTDPGIDDAMALLFLARAADVEIVGVTTGFGNGTVETTTRNALHLCEMFDIDAPVAQGAGGPLAGTDEPADHVHGSDGLGDVRAIGIPARSIHPLPAAEFIVETVRRHPGEISIVAVGRLTNLALALRLDPAIAQRVREVIVMGGAFGFRGHSGNVSPVAEANIFGDPLAANETLGAPWPVTLVPLDVTQETIMSPDYLDRIGEGGGAAGTFMRDITRFYERFHETAAGIRGIYAHDSLAVAYLLDPSLFATRTGPILVVTEGIATGQTIQKAGGRKIDAPTWDARPAQTICIDVRSERVLDLYYRTIVGDRV